MKTGGKSTQLKQVTKFIADATKLSNELQRMIKKAEAHRAKLLRDAGITNARGQSGKNNCARLSPQRGD